MERSAASAEASAVKTSQSFEAKAIRASGREVKRTKLTSRPFAMNQAAAFSSVVVPVTTQTRAPSSCSALVMPSTAWTMKPWPS